MVSVELNHQSTGICQREKVAFEKSHMPHIFHVLKSKVGAAYVLSTCNRFSIYSSTDDPQCLVDFFSMQGIDPSLVSITRGEEQCAQKLFETASGLRSQFYGERQILSQIKEYYQIAIENHSLDRKLDLLVRSAIHSGKEVQRQTGLYRLNNSLVDAVYEVIAKNISKTKNDRIIIFGTGSMAKHVARKLIEKGLMDIHVVGRDADRLKDFGNKYRVKTINYSEFLKLMTTSFDIFIGATDQKIDLSGFLSNVHNRIIQLIDLGVPRNFDPALRAVSTIDLVDLENLHGSLRSDTSLTEEMVKAHEIVSSEVQRFLMTLNRVNLSPYAGAYWRKLQQSGDIEFEWLMPKLKNLDEAQRKLIKRYSHRLLRSLSHDVMEYINEMADSGKGINEVDILKKVFKLPLAVVKGESIRVEVP